VVRRLGSTGKKQRLADAEGWTWNARFPACCAEIKLHEAREGFPFPECLPGLQPRICTCIIHWPHAA